MNMIWRLFGTHILFLGTILTLLILWLVWPRRFKTFRKRLLRLNGFILLVAIITALFTYWPRSYEKHYLNSTIPQEIENTPLRSIADSLDFYIGMATSSESPYLEQIATEFNSIVAENEFKPNQLLRNPTNWEFDFTKADQLLDYALTNNLRVRGHTLIWGKFPGRTYPKEWNEMVNESIDNVNELKGIIEKYVEEVMGHFKGRISSWDVINEPMGGESLYPSLFTNILGEKYIDIVFHAAHKADPDCKLYLNEAVNDYNDPSGQAFLALLKRLLDRGVPIHGVGLQTHHLFSLHNTTELADYIDQISQMGLEVEITELDVRLLLFHNAERPYEAQGEQFRKIVDICTQASNCKGVTLWGMSDKNNWMDAIPPFSWKSPNAPNIYDEDMNRKPAYIGIWQSLNEALQKTYW